MSDEMKECPKCNSPYGSFLKEDLFECTESSNQWNPTEATEEEKEDVLIVKDANGNVLENGDYVVVSLRGACGSCAKSQTTLKQYVEKKLREQVLDKLIVEEDKG